MSPRTKVKRQLVVGVVAVLLGLGCCGFPATFGNDWDALIPTQIAGVCLLVGGGMLMLYSILRIITGG